MSIRLGSRLFWAELSIDLSGTESAGRVVRVGGMFKRNSSKEFSLRVLAWSYFHGMMPLLGEFSIEFFIGGSMS